MPEGYTIHTKKTFLETEEDLADEFRRWGVAEWSLRKVTAGGARLRWIPRDGDATVALESSDQRTFADNARKLFLIVEALRLNEARGFKDQVASFYEQTSKALTVRPEDVAASLAPYTTLGVRPDTDTESIEAVYRSLLRRHHPDVAGPDGNRRTAEINDAWAAIRRLRGLP